MSLLSAVEEIAATQLPQDLVKALKQLKRRLPFKLLQAAPVVQTFIHDGHTRSVVGVHNFYSCFFPQRVTNAIVELTFHDPQGRIVLRHADKVPHLASLGVDVDELFRRRGVDAPFGIVTAQLTPEHPRRPLYRDLGIITAQFFMFYYDPSGSVEQIHPLSTVSANNRPAGAFLSNQMISTTALSQIELFQYNPRMQPHCMEHRLLEARSRELVAAQRSEIAPMGTARVTFHARDLPARAEQLLLAIDDLPSSNAKPMLRRVFESGLHSMSHA